MCVCVTTQTLDEWHQHRCAFGHVASPTGLLWTCAPPPTRPQHLSSCYSSVRASVSPWASAHSVQTPAPGCCVECNTGAAAPTSYSTIIITAATSAVHVYVQHDTPTPLPATPYLLSRRLDLLYRLWWRFWLPLFFVNLVLVDMSQLPRKLLDTLLVRALCDKVCQSKQTRACGQGV